MLSRDILENELFDLLDGIKDGTLPLEKAQKIARRRVEDANDLLDALEADFHTHFPRTRTPFVEQDVEPTLIGFMLLEGSEKNYARARKLVEDYFMDGAPKFMAKPRYDWIALGLAFKIDLLKSPKKYGAFLKDELHLSSFEVERTLDAIEAVKNPRFELRDDYDSTKAVIEILRDKIGQPPRRPGNGNGHRNGGPRGHGHGGGR